MDDALVVEHPHGLGHLQEEARAAAVEARRPHHAALLLEEVTEGLPAFDALEDDVVQTAVDADVQQGQDRGVRETSGDPRLPFEAPELTLGEAVLGVQDLDRDEAADVGVPGPPDRARAPAPEELEQLLPADGVASGRRSSDAGAM